MAPCQFASVDMADVTRKPSRRCSKCDSRRPRQPPRTTRAEARRRSERARGGLAAGMDPLEMVLSRWPRGMAAFIAAKAETRDSRCIYNVPVKRGVCCCWWVWLVVRLVCVPLCVRVSRVSRVCPGSPRCLFTGKKTQGGAGTLTGHADAQCTGILFSIVKTKKSPGEPDTPVGESRDTPVPYCTSRGSPGRCRPHRVGGGGIRKPSRTV